MAKILQPKGSPKDGVSRRDFIIRAGTMASGVILAGGVGAAAAAVATGRDRLLPIEPVQFSRENPLRVALIGAGGRMTFGLLPAILESGEVRVVACADPDPSHLNRILDRIERATGLRPRGLPGERDFAAALGRDDVQAAFSATPCDLHAPIYLEALRRGKHLYGEKPLALSLAEINSLNEAWPASRAVLQIGFQRRSSARYAEGIRRLRDGEIGEMIEARAAWNNAGGPPGAAGWLGQRARSGDWMLEQACHTWDTLRWATGATPKAAYGAGRRDLFAADRPGRDMTDSYTATLEYADGLVASFSHTWSAPVGDNGAFSGVYERILGTRGGIDLGAGRISYADRERKAVVLPPDEADMTRAAVRDFLACVREGRQPASGVDTAADATLTGLLVRKAVDERRRVTMDEILAG